MSGNGRDLALQIIYRINEEDAYANIALDEALRKSPIMDPREKSFVTELVYGSVKNKGHLDWLIDQFAKPKVQKMAPWIRNIIRLGLYQLLFLDQIPASAAVNESVKLAKKYGHRGTIKFVNGVLRNIQRNLEKINYPDFNTSPVEYLEVFHSHPRWMVEDWVERFGARVALELCKYNNNPAPFWIRANTLKVNREELKEILNKEGVQTLESSFVAEGLRILNNVNLSQLRPFQEGLFTVQDESSMLVGHVVDPQPGELIWDVCGAPGGKTGHLAQLMSNQGKIMAFDIFEHRLKLIDEASKRLGIKIVKTQLQDARLLEPSSRQAADRVLVDAPCSGLGVLNRRADARWKKNPEDILELAKIQKEILQTVAPFVKNGGVLVYSTCTITPEENRMVIEDFLAKYPEFYLDHNLPQYLSISNGGKEGWIQLLPYLHGLDGFFIARMKKKLN